MHLPIINFLNLLFTLSTRLIRLHASQHISILFLVTADQQWQHTEKRLLILLSRVVLLTECHGDFIVGSGLIHLLLGLLFSLQIECLACSHLPSFDCLYSSPGAWVSTIKIKLAYNFAQQTQLIHSRQVALLRSFLFDSRRWVCALSIFYQLWLDLWHSLARVSL